ncbi:thioredoxin family protein [Falsiruegeria mediterranea]
MIPMISPAEAQEFLKRDGVNVVGFKAPWCPQCEPQRGVVERLIPRHEGKVDFAYIDLETHPDAQEAFDISALPALHIAKDGAVQERLSGFTKAPLLNQKLQAICG